MNAKRVGLILAILLVIAAAPGFGATFAQFTETTPTQTLFTLTNNGGLSLTISVTNGAIDYKFSVPNPLGTAFRPGLLNFTGNSSTPATLGGGNINELGFSGSGSIFDVLTSTVSLSWTYGPSGTLQLADGGTGGTFQDSRPPATEVVFSSPYLNFTTSTSESFSFALSGAATPFSQGPGNFPNSNSASVVGTFDATPLPTGGVPEPGTLALLGSALCGVGLIGRKYLPE